MKTRNEYNLNKNIKINKWKYTKKIGFKMRKFAKR